MNVGSLFSGIGGFDLGLERAGHRIVFQCEKDEYRRRVLKRHWPGIPCWSDIVHIRESASGGSADGVRPPAHLGRWEAGSGLPGDIDLLCGGFPCQDLSVAGRRAGLAGERSGLFFEFARIADALLTDGGWLLIENVPGLLSSNGGRDFAVLLSTLAELGFHDLAWRVLDSRYLGVPQRRRRVFILARRSRGRCASEVLLEPESGGGDFEAGGETGQGTPGSFGQGVAGTLGNRQSGGFRTTDLDNNGAYVAGPGRAEADSNGVRAPSGIPERSHDPVMWQLSHEGRDAWKTDYATALERGGPYPRGQGQIVGLNGTAVPPTGVCEGSPIESCALDPKPDGPRYAACGDAVTVNVAHWIGLRLTQVGE